MTRRPARGWQIVFYALLAWAGVVTAGLGVAALIFSVPKP